MSSPAIISAWNFRPPINAAIVDGKGVTLSVETQFRTNLQKLLQQSAVVNVASFGAQGNGRTDDTNAFQQSISQAISISSQLGIGVVQIPSGTFMLSSVSLPVGGPPIVIMGQGRSSLVKRSKTLAPGIGIFDVMSSNASLMNFAIDAVTTTPRGLQYNHDFIGVEPNDPMAASLSQNTSVWLHGGTSGFSCYQMTFQHAAGYSILLDARTAGINDVDIIECSFRNNRPTLLGTTPGQLIYGSWNGGVLAMGDGRTSAQQVVSDLLVAQCRFSRNTGNCFWSALYGLNALHAQFRITDNDFIDCGLDGIEIGGVTGGIVQGNTLRRIGYTTLTDTDQSVPRWLPNLNATAIDSSGLVINVPYVGNSILNSNGGGIDTDSHGQSSISTNVIRVSAPGDPEYIEDQIAICGPTNSGAEGYGINTNNSGNGTLGGANITIVGNQLVNLSAGAIRLFAARDCLVEGNNIIAPNTPVGPPISIGPVGTGPNQRATRNKICHNRFYYNPGSAAPCVFEDGTITPFVSTDVNDCFGNCRVYPVGTAAIEFEPNASSGSPTYLQTVWFT